MRIDSGRRAPEILGQHFPIGSGYDEWSVGQFGQVDAPGGDQLPEHKAVRPRQGGLVRRLLDERTPLVHRERGTASPVSTGTDKVLDPFD